MSTAPFVRLLVALMVPCGCGLLGAADLSPDERRAAAREDFVNGNYRDAWETFRALSLDPDTDSRQVVGDFEGAMQCLRKLGQFDEIDEFRDQAARTHPENWRLLRAAAASYLDGPHYGYIFAEQFSRAVRLGSGRSVSSFARDRVRGLQLMEQALPLVADETDRSSVGQFFLDFARILLHGRAGWRLLGLTDLSGLPDFDSDGYDAWSGGSSGAPVDDTGNPIFHRVPESYQAARTDGERWRWALRQAALSHPDQSRLKFAHFLRSQFGVQTLTGGFGLFGRASQDDQADSGPWAVQTLSDEETIARLASGPKRFQMPDEFNFLRIYRAIAESGAEPHAAEAMSALADIYSDRRQYPRAADLWRTSIERFGDDDEKSYELQQIVGNWGQFGHLQIQPAGRPASVEFRYRNGPQVTFEAHQVDIEKLLAEMKDHLSSKPETLDWDKVSVQDVGHRLLTKEGKRFLGRRVARWDVELDPAPDHFDRLLTVTTPLKDAGAYLLTAKMKDGNTSRIVVWIADTTIVAHPMKNGMHFFVADAVTGAPVPDAWLEFVGFHYREASSPWPRRPIPTRNFTGKTDEQGQAVISSEKQDAEFDWIVIARTAEGGLAYLGFDDVWYDDPDDYRHGETRRAFAATDRPVYRPEQSVKFKLWSGLPTYKTPDISHTAGREFTVRIVGPRGEKVFERQLKADEHGGIDGEWTIPARATLGRYSIFLLLYGSHIDGRGTFRVEEYKKPEFEVVVEVPTEPVRLGEKITATLRARYYFGAPVTDARVRYQVTRSSYMADWWPSGRWDWLYGPGYWCYAPAYDWYPGWRRWSSRLLTTTVPAGGWWWDDRLYGVPEVVLDTEVEIGPDGSVAIEFDTALAKKLHDDRDHRYEITAEVIDRSRRTVTGSGEVLVARDPFQVFAWLDRGYCRAGDTVRASFQARTLDHQPVKGEGRLTLLRVTYPDGKPVETEIESWDLPTNDRGETSLPITAAEAGQYRLSYHVTDQQGRTVEGGYLFHVIGEGFDGRGFRYNDLELVVEKPEYRPGETLRLLINTNRPDSTVLLFVRPVEGIYQPAEVLRLKGKSTVHEIEVTRADMPNFFIEACTVSDGQFHWDIREVVVPPEQQVVNVEVLPSSGEYKPGEEAKLRVKLTDAAGKPFNGSTVLTVYDKSLEAIAGGPNVKDIRQVFWDWLREHYSIAPEDVSTLVHDSFPLVREGQVEMEVLGVFGLLLFPPDQAQRQDELSQFSPMATEHAMMGMGGMGGMGLGDMGMGGMGMGGMGGSNSFPTNLSMVVRDRPSPNGHTARDSSRLVEPSLRTELADTAFWAANLTPDENGIVEVAFPVPENLTTWKVRAWTLGSGTRVGQGESEIITTKNLLVRMQAPRFFMEQDEVVLSANVHNYLNEAKQARVLMELEGDLLMPLDSLERSVRVAADGEQRIDWRVRATRAGEAVVRMKVMTDEESDGMEMRFPVHVHGMLKTDSFTGVIRPDEESAVIEVAVPEERRADETRLEVRYSPTLAGAMVDALPYLVDYPYGCTEQTLNRFLPTVITQGVLRRMGVDLAAIREKQTNLNPRELGDPRQRAGQWRRWPKQNPVFDEAEVERMVIVGIQRLTEMQVGDGGWGWFSGFGEHSYPHTTAVVVYGLQTAKECGVEFDMQVLKEGLDWLMTYQTEQVRLLKNAELPANTRQTQRFKSHADNIDAFVYMVLIDAGHVDGDMERYLYRDRTKLSPYAMAMFGLALHRQENEEKLAMVLRNLEQFLVEDDENQTAYLRLPSESWWWRWYGHSVEANAFYLKLLVRTDPQDRRASRLVKYLLNNRKNGRYWTSTRDTAYAIEALAEYLDASDEMRAEMVVEVWFDGEKQQEVKIDAGNLFDFDNQWLALGDAVPSGVRRVELRRRGIGPLYYNAWLTNFTLEDFITRTGLEVQIDRHYFRLHRQDGTEQVPGMDGRPVDRRVERYQREPLDNLATVTSGDLIEVELIVESRNDYEYLIFEDKKAAGFEPVEVRSGYFPNDLGAYMELRDERVSFFVRSLPRGRHSLRYRLRAEVPGRFSALPAAAWGMYTPELQGNSEEMKLSVTDETSRESRSTSSESADGSCR